MIFNSFTFAIFFFIVFFLYWFVFNKKLRWQNVLIAVASYVFYGWWDWRFLSLILFSTVVDYSIAIGIHNSKNELKRKALLWLSLVVNLGLLGVFKYYNFFLESLYDLTPGFQAVLGFNTLEIILPVGISFYTFQTLSYTIDVYRKKLEPTKDFVVFASFVSFFPQLVAGPIERATNLLPQFLKKRSFRYDQAVRGSRQILWGLFKKIVIADNCAIYANAIFDNSEDLSGSTLLLGAIFFSFQIYGDFSGYSDIAIGIARLLGFDLMKNFAYPYFSRDIAEFWRRWHISLSTWFRDYLYIPLGGSRGGTWMKVRNTFVIFIVSGFWHGANWTFLIWGALNAIYFLPLLLTKRNRAHLGVVAESSCLPNFRELIQMGLTFALTVFAWIFFRAENIDHAIDFVMEIFGSSLFTVPYYEGLGFSRTLILLLFFFLTVEWFGRKDDYAIAKFRWLKKRYQRLAFYAFIVFLIGMYAPSEQSEFIYFQF